MPPITVFCPFTRPERVKPFFDDLASTDLKPENTNLALIVDCNKEEGGATIYARIMEEMNRTNFRKFLIIRNFDHHVNLMNIPIRRRRIAEIHEQSKDLIKSLDGLFVLGLEDDTVFTNLCVQRLYQPFTGLSEVVGDKIGFVTAYEAGRWHNKIIGIWNFDNIEDPRECWTELPDKDYQDCDAAGFYCYLTPTDLYLKHEYSTENWQPWGPDVNYGLWLRKLGYRNIVDWSQPCGHSDGDIIITPNNNLYVERFNKLDQPTWERQRQQ
jgi:hypothetical protein